jgi:hypothetical protein
MAIKLRKLVLIGMIYLVMMNFAATPAWCFSSHIHDGITIRSVSRKYESHSAIQEIMNTVEAVDSVETAFIVTANRQYKSEHHFDRNPKLTNQAAFLNGVAYVAQKKEEAINAIQQGDSAGAKKALRAMSQALHAIQDFYAHSNYVNLSDRERSIIQKAFRKQSRYLPSDLKLTGFDPFTWNPIEALFPTGDPYPHGVIFGDNKDLGWGKDGREACDLAIKHSRLFLVLIRKEVGNETWKSRFLNY